MNKKASLFLLLSSLLFFLFISCGNKEEVIKINMPDLSFSNVSKKDPFVQSIVFTRDEPQKQTSFRLSMRNLVSTLEEDMNIPVSSSPKMTSVNKTLSLSSITKNSGTQMEDVQQADQSIVSASATNTDGGEDEIQALENSDYKKTKESYVYQRYLEAIENAKTEKSYEAFYYAGMSYYQLMLQSHLSIENRRNYYNNALDLLKKVYTYHPSPNRRALALFWSAKAVQINSQNAQDQLLTINLLKKIDEDLELRKTSRLNDSFYFLAKIYSKSNKILAKEYLIRLKGVEDDSIWDADKNKLITKNQAVAHLEQILNDNNLATTVQE